MSPYHGELPDETTQLIDHLQADDKKIITALFLYAKDHYLKIRNAVIVVGLIVSIGCAFGIQQGVHLGKSQHIEDTRQQKDNKNLIKAQAVIIEQQKDLLHKQIDLTTAQCWGNFDGRLVLRVLISGGIHAPITKDELQVLNRDPTFKQLIILGTRNNKAFAKTALPLLPLPKCKGHNPNPALPKLLKAAGAPINIKQ